MDVAIARFEGTCPGVEVEPIYKEEIVLAVRADVLSKARALALNRLSKS